MGAGGNHTKSVEFECVLRLGCSELAVARRLGQRSGAAG